MTCFSLACSIPDFWGFFGLGKWLSAITHSFKTFARLYWATHLPGLTMILNLFYLPTKSDTIFKGSRWPPMVFGGVRLSGFLSCWGELELIFFLCRYQIINIVCYVSLAIWDIPINWKWGCFILAGASYGLGGLCMAYILLPPQAWNQLKWARYWSDISQLGPRNLRRW